MFGSRMAANPDENTNKRKHDYEQQRYEGGRRSTSGGSSSEVYGRGYPREDTPPAQCSVLCGPRSCSTLPSSLGHQNDCGTSPPEPKRRRMWGLRGLVKMFRRRVRRKGGPESTESPQAPAPAIRARSASELTVDPANRNSGGGPYNQGLSVSHDSVFSPESPTEQTHTPPSGLALATRGVNMSELKAALRRRRGVDSGSVEDEFDDPGLPRSPPTSPTTLDVLNHGLKSSSRGAQSSCSDGSLLSMGSSENDEDSYGVISHHSSKHSLFESRHQVVDNEPAVGAAPLSHKAARHKISVRPKRTHGIPLARKQTQNLPSNLPTTPEVNEDTMSSRNDTSEVVNASFSPSTYIHQDGQRPSSISFTSVETHFVKSRVDRSLNRDRRSDRKSLPNPPSQMEERREDPFLNRGVFGSGRSGQPQMERNDVVETSIEGTRLSREKRKDQFRTPTGIKSSRQKSDPTRLTFSEEMFNDRNSSQRSSSVEGRLEGNPLQNNFELDTPIPAPPEFEMDTTTLSDEVVHDAGIVAANRLSSSFDDLNEDMIPQSLATSQNQMGYSMESCEGRSSTDSLTTTPLPGIYIRSNQSSSRSRRSSGLQQARESISRFKEEQQRHMDMEATGPLSLDSSLNLVQHVGEEFRKTLSSDEVPFNKGTIEIDSSNNISIPRPSSIMRSVSVNSPSSSRGSSVRSRKSSIGDELESDSSLTKISLRKIKRESSFKKPTEEELPEPVPEFLRIQLNRVQNKTSSVVEPNVSSGTNKTSIVNVREWTEVSPRNVVANEELEKLRDQSEIIVGGIGGKKLVEVNYMNKANEKNSIMSVSPNENNMNMAVSHSEKNTNRAVSPNEKNTNMPVSHNEKNVSVIQSQILARGISKKSQDETTKREEKEEIILRRPSVVDRAIVIDQSMGALPSSSPTTKGEGDEPELFKVFARRSFKLKDPELDSSYKVNEGDKENYLPSSSIDFSVTSGNLQRKTERHSVIPNMSPSTAVKASLPILKNISSKRYSFDNTSVSYSNPNEIKSVLLQNKISVEESESVCKGSESTVFKGKTNETVLNNPFPKPQGYFSPQIKGSNIHTDEITADKGLVLDDSMNQTQMSNIIAKQGVQNLNLKNSQSKNLAEKEIQANENENISSSFDSAIIRRSAVASSSNQVSETITLEPEPQVHHPKFPKGQPIVWPPRNQPSNEPTDSGTSPTSRSSLSSNSSISSLPYNTPQGRTSLPNSRIINSFKEHYIQPHDENDSHSSSNDDEIPHKKLSLPIDMRRKSLKEGITGSPIFAEARNTSFAHSFDSHSNPLAVSYLGRGETAGLKLNRKGSMDETRSSPGGADDWRVLVKQRREDRMKQTKTPDSEEIIIETRPTVSRNSKVLEMANNFQKLQVA